MSIALERRWFAVVASIKVAEFSDLMTQVEAWGAEHGVRFTEWREQA